MELYRVGTITTHVNMAPPSHVDPYGNVRIVVNALRQEGGEDFHQILIGRVMSRGSIQVAGPMLIRQNQPVRDCSLTLSAVAPPVVVGQTVPAPPSAPLSTKPPASQEPQQSATPAETAEPGAPLSETPDYTQTCQQYIISLSAYRPYSLTLEKSDWGKTYYRVDPSTLVASYTSYDVKGAPEPLVAICYSLAHKPAFSFAEIIQNVSGGKVVWCLLPGKVVSGDCPLTNEHPIILSDAGGETGRKSAVMRCIMSAVHKTDQIARLRSTMSAGDPARAAAANDIENLTMSARDICEKNPDQLFQ